MRYAFSILSVVALLACVSSCTKADNTRQVPTPTAIPTIQSNLVVPNVSYVPAGWYLSSDNVSLRSLEYRNNVSDDYVRICYGEVSSELAGNETNESEMVEQAAAAANFTSMDKGITAVGGKLAGWAQAYDGATDLYQTEIVFVTNNTYVEAYALCRSIRLSEVEKLIYSIR